DVGRRVRGGRRPQLLARVPAAARLRSRPDPGALRHAAPLDALLSTGRLSACDPGRRAALGLQAPGALHPPPATLARDPVGEGDRSPRTAPPQGDLADVLPARPPVAPRHALVREDGAPRVVLRAPELPVPRSPPVAGSLAGGVLGHSAGRRRTLDAGCPSAAHPGAPPPRTGGRDRHERRRPALP